MIQTGINISSDVAALDVDFIHTFISNSYWSMGRTLTQTRQCIAHSRNFGIYLDGKQIGYARVVTDYTVFAYLMDVFIDEGQRGKGYSKHLVKYIMDDEPLRAVKSWKLASQDAQGLYEQFGFRPLSKPERMMEKLMSEPA